MAETVFQGLVVANENSLEQGKNQEMTEEQEEISFNDFKPIVEFINKNNRKITIFIVIVTIILLFYYLGYISGFSKAFAGQKEYYAQYMADSCTCFLNV